MALPNSFPSVQRIKWRLAGISSSNPMMSEMKPGTMSRRPPIITSTASAVRPGGREPLPKDSSNAPQVRRPSR